jgi:hypothetical protein
VLELIKLRKTTRLRQKTCRRDLASSRVRLRPKGVIMNFVGNASKVLPVCILTLSSLLSAATASAAIQQHTFSISGNNGETGSGTFTWDDSVVPNGSSLANDSSSLPAEVLTISINMSGGNTAGGSTTFTRAVCTGAYLHNTPDFTVDINFWCDNGTNSLYGVDPYTNDLNGGVSTLTFTPGTTAPVAVAPTSIPTLSEWGVIILSSLLALGTIVTLRRRPQ